MAKKQQNVIVCKDIESADSSFNAKPLPTTLSKDARAIVAQLGEGLKASDLSASKFVCRAIREALAGHTTDESDSLLSQSLNILIREGNGHKLMNVIINRFVKIIKLDLKASVKKCKTDKASFKYVVSLSSESPVWEGVKDQFRMDKDDLEHSFHIFAETKGERLAKEAKEAKKKADAEAKQKAENSEQISDTAQTVQDTLDNVQCVNPETLPVNFTEFCVLAKEWAGNDPDKLSKYFSDSIAWLKNEISLAKQKELQAK